MKTILIIDDDESILTIFCMVLKHHGFRILQATSAAVGLELARRERPDLILTDMTMPGEDGQALLHHIRQDPQLASRPVILMTGDADFVLPPPGQETGADGLLIKPVTMEALVRCVRENLEKAGEPHQA